MENIDKLATEIAEQVTILEVANELMVNEDVKNEYLRIPWLDFKREKIGKMTDRNQKRFNSFYNEIYNIAHKILSNAKA